MFSGESSAAPDVEGMADCFMHDVQILASREGPLQLARDQAGAPRADVSLQLGKPRDLSLPRLLTAVRAFFCA